VILVADDNEFSREEARRLLTQMGHEVIEAVDGQEALDALADTSRRIDLILLDLRMPQVDGDEVLQRVKSTPALSHIPILIFTSSVDGLDQVASYVERGAEDYLHKDGDPRLLQARVSNCLAKKFLIEDQERTLALLQKEKARLKAQTNSNEELLNALLPHRVKMEIVAEYLATGHINVRPTRLASSAVLFCDIVGFTEFCEQEDPCRVIEYLHGLFSEFEAICARHKLEKIKTIGDSFMATAGLEEFVRNPVRACINAGLEMLAAAQARTPPRELRIGIDFGSVVTGIVGTSRFQYDIWGRAVNMASRVESEGENGRINLSEAAWLEVTDECQASAVWRELQGLGRHPIYVFRGFGNA